MLEQEAQGWEKRASGGPEWQGVREDILDKKLMDERESGLKKGKALFLTQFISEVTLKHNQLRFSLPETFCS